MANEAVAEHTLSPGLRTIPYRVIYEVTSCAKTINSWKILHSPTLARCIAVPRCELAPGDELPRR